MESDDLLSDVTSASVFIVKSEAANKFKLDPFGAMISLLNNIVPPVIKLQRLHHLALLKRDPFSFSSMKAFQRPSSIIGADRSSLRLIEMSWLCEIEISTAPLNINYCQVNCWRNINLYIYASSIVIVIISPIAADGFLCAHWQSADGLCRSLIHGPGVSSLV